MKLYVGNLPYSLSEDDIRNMLAEFGEVGEVNMISDRATGRPKGFGFAEMANQSEAEAAMEALDQKEIEGRNIKVNEAKPKEDRPRRSPRY